MPHNILKAPVLRTMRCVVAEVPFTDHPCHIARIGEDVRDQLRAICDEREMVASFAIQHEALGSCMWNYQMWVDKNPVRIRTDGKRVPVDVFQRLLNANFNLNVDRAKLVQDLSYFALDDKGADTGNAKQYRHGQDCAGDGGSTGVRQPAPVPFRRSSRHRSIESGRGAS